MRSVGLRELGKLKFLGWGVASLLGLYWEMQKCPIGQNQGLERRKQL